MPRGGLHIFKQGILKSNLFRAVEESTDYVGFGYFFSRFPGKAHNRSKTAGLKTTGLEMVK